MSDLKKLLTVRDAAAHMGLAERTVRLMLADGRLEKVKLRGLRRIRIPEQSLRALIETRRGPSKHKESA